VGKNSDAVPDYIVFINADLEKITLYNIRIWIDIKDLLKVSRISDKIISFFFERPQSTLKVKITVKFHQLLEFFPLAT